MQVLRKLDFTKYNKGLRLIVTLYDLNPDVINDNFVDIVILSEYTIGLIYKNLYDEDIYTELTNHKYYYNNRSVNYKGKSYSAYTFTLIKEEDKLKYLGIVGVGPLIVSAEFYVKMCITWKKYLDDSFYDSLNFDASEQCKQRSQA